MATWKISRHLTRKDCDHFLERIVPYLNSLQTSTQRQYDRDTYLNTHEVIVQQFGATTSTFIEKLAEFYVTPSIRREENREAFEQYERLA